MQALPLACMRIALIFWPSISKSHFGGDMQEVEYVKEEAKLQYLLACLQKTAPPTLIFAENKNDVDLIHEYLLMKGVEAVSVHGGKDQEDRVHAIDSFKVNCSPCPMCISGRHMRCRLVSIIP